MKKWLCYIRNSSSDFQNQSNLVVELSVLQWQCNNLIQFAFTTCLYYFLWKSELQSFAITFNGKSKRRVGYKSLGGSTTILKDHSRHFSTRERASPPLKTLNRVPTSIRHARWTQVFTLCIVLCALADFFQASKRAVVHGRHKSHFQRSYHNCLLASTNHLFWKNAKAIVAAWMGRRKNT